MKHLKLKDGKPPQNIWQVQDGYENFQHNDSMHISMRHLETSIQNLTSLFSKAIEEITTGEDDDLAGKLDVIIEQNKIIIAKLDSLSKEKSSTMIAPSAQVQPIISKEDIPRLIPRKKGKYEF